MAFRDFGFPEVLHDLGLTLAEADLYVQVAALDLGAEFVTRMRDEVALGLMLHTEKARSEFIIAPVLAELRRRLKGIVGLFSGIEFNVDASRGLNGYCDFILTRSPLQSVLTAPAVSIVEAKNDNIRNGLGQCIAAMVAAREFNAKAGATGPVHGVVTTGAAWKFLRLDGDTVTLDQSEHAFTELGRIMAILESMLRPPTLTDPVRASP